MKILPTFLHTLLVLVGLLAAADNAKAQLLLTNGNFQDLTGLTAQPGSPGWYQGVPAGWSSSTANLNFNVIDYSSGNLGANLQTLGPSSPSFTPLYQSAGLVPSTGNVTLSFNILGFSGTYGMTAAIYNATPGGSPMTTWTLLTSATYDETSGSFQTLVAPNITANTPIGVAFWQFSGSPGIDNVTVVPEPSTSLLLLGATALGLLIRKRRR